jgi:RNA polymerase sigma-70 factor (ECF subfamily)
LLAACRRGDRQALDRVLREHLPAVEQVLARLAGPTADLEDLVQTTLVAAVTAFPRFRGEASIKTWLTRIAVHVFHEYLRRPERKRKVSLEVLAGGTTPIDRSPPPDEVVDQRRRLERLYHHLDAIGAKKRIAFILHVIEGRPVDEVAAIARASVVATKSRIFWARRELLARVRKDPSLRDVVEEVLS